MKKQRKQFMILLIVLVASVGGYFGLRYYNENAADTEIENTEYIIELAEDSIVRVSFSYEGEELAFVKEDGTWKYEADLSLNIDQTQLGLLESKGEAMPLQEKIEGVTDMSQYGLEEPERYITFETQEQVYTFYVGDQNSFSNEYYIRWADSDTVYMVRSAVVTVFNKTLEDLVEEET